MHNLINYKFVFGSSSGLTPVLAKKLKPYDGGKYLKLKPVETSLELKTLVFPMIIALGPYLHQDTLLIGKLIRICRTLLADPVASVAIRYDVHTVLDDAILPSISLVDSNCSLSEELWLLVKNFPYQMRYKLYTNWKNEPQNALMIRTRAATLKRIKYIMKRLSKENVKISGRQIGKLTHSYPSFLFEYVRRKLLKIGLQG